MIAPRSLSAPLTALILGGAVLTLGACTAPAGGKEPTPITPTERYAMQVAERPEQVALAPHATGLSENQRGVLTRFARTWSDNGGGVISISAPADGGEVATRTAYAAKAMLQSVGVDPDALRIAGYAADKPGAPILVAYDSYQAVIPRCGKAWTNLGATRNNDTQANFGCAITANMAAQVANPRDIAHPRNMDPADAGRRQTVMDKYRKGDPTAAKSDTGPGAKTSDAVAQ